MRLIDADAFAKKAYDVAYPVVHGRNDHERGLTLLGLAQLLDEMPVVEAVPVIRCKDCKYCQSWKENTCNLPEHNWCGTLQMLTHAGDYCAWSPNLDEDEEC